MKITTELIVVIIAIVIFYLRIAMLRGQKKRYERELALKRRKVKGRSKGSPLPQQPKGTPPFAVRSWLLVTIAFVLMLVGIVAYNKFMIYTWEIVKNASFVDTYAKYWYLSLTAGVLLLAYSITIQKPIDDSKE